MTGFGGTVEQQTVSVELAIALGPSYVPKAGKATAGNVLKYRLNFCACLLSTQTRQKINM